MRVARRTAGLPSGMAMPHHAVRELDQRERCIRSPPAGHSASPRASQWCCSSTTARSTLMAQYGIQKIGAIVSPQRPAEQGARAGLPAQRPEGARDRRGRTAAADGAARSATSRSSSMCSWCATPTCCLSDPRSAFRHELLGSAHTRRARCDQRDAKTFSPSLRRRCKTRHGRDRHGRHGADDLHLGHRRLAQGRDAVLSPTSSFKTRRDRELQRRSVPTTCSSRSRRSITSPAW